MLLTEYLRREVECLLHQNLSEVQIFRYFLTILPYIAIKDLWVSYIYDNRDTPYSWSKLIDNSVQHSLDHSSPQFQHKSNLKRKTCSIQATSTTYRKSSTKPNTNSMYNNCTSPSTTQRRRWTTDILFWWALSQLLFSSLSPALPFDRLVQPVHAQVTFR